MIFSSLEYRLLKSRLRTKYKSNRVRVLLSFKNTPHSQLKTWVKENASYLVDYSNLNWFFLKQIETFASISVQKPENEESKLELSQSEEKLFDIWNESEFADVFLKALNSGKSIKSASRLGSKFLDQHLTTLAMRHIEKVDATSLYYRGQVALGERTKGKKTFKLLETTLHLEGKELRLMTPSLKEMKHFSHRIEVALKVIRKFSPSSWERFTFFTDVIIPIKNKEFVSFSHQDFPGVSMINMYDRDFVDLMDDLLHENGHHHLNHYLNLGKLIDEPAELIYYSPWRRTPRPLRGIFHAYFTFFWAFKLFSDIISTSQMDNIWYQFNTLEKEKIIWRAVEEFWMLDFTYQDLLWAKNKGLITDTGWVLIREQKRELNKLQKKVRTWERKIKKHRKEFVQLKSDLKKAALTYQKN